MRSATVVLVLALACCEGGIYTDSSPKGQSNSGQQGSATGSTNPSLNGSGVLLPEFRALDRDGDGFLSKKEVEGYPRASASDFAQADKDGDGRLSYEEFKTLHANTSTDRRLGS
jgi:hypothetical protein